MPTEAVQKEELMSVEEKLKQRELEKQALKSKLNEVKNQAGYNYANANIVNRALKIVFTCTRRQNRCYK